MEALYSKTFEISPVATDCFGRLKPSMMLFFAAVMAIFKIGNYDNLGFAAMLIAHTTFCLPYVILSVLPRINELGESLTEAALDLGCTPAQAFFKVKLPNIMPGVLSGMVMAFTGMRLFHH